MSDTESRGSAVSEIVPIASASARVAFTELLSTTVSVSKPSSSRESMASGTRIVFVTWPAPKTSVSSTAV